MRKIWIALIMMTPVTVARGGNENCNEDRIAT